MAGHLDRAFGVLNQDRAESTLEKVAAKTMGPVEDTKRLWETWSHRILTPLNLFARGLA
jgi:hypothetical protein